MTTARKALLRVRKFLFERGYDLDVSAKKLKGGVLVVIEDFDFDDETTGLLMQIAANDGFMLHINGR